MKAPSFHLSSLFTLLMNTVSFIYRRSKSNLFEEKARNLPSFTAEKSSRPQLFFTPPFPSFQMGKKRGEFLFNFLGFWWLFHENAPSLPPGNNLYSLCSLVCSVPFPPGKRFFPSLYAMPLRLISSFLLIPSLLLLYPLSSCSLHSLSFYSRFRVSDKVFSRGWVRRRAIERMGEDMKSEEEEEEEDDDVPDDEKEGRKKEWQTSRKKIGEEGEKERGKGWNETRRVIKWRVLSPSVSPSFLFNFNFHDHHRILLLTIPTIIITQLVLYSSS